MMGPGAPGGPAGRPMMGQPQGGGMPGCPMMGAGAQCGPMQKGAGRMPMHCWKGAAALMLICFVVHILLTVWVYQDVRRRNASSGIWIVVTLLTGLLGAAVYALVRIGEKPA